MMHDKRKTIGLRVPEHPVVKALLEAMDEPLMSTSLLLPAEEDGIIDLDEIEQSIGHELGAIIDAGYCQGEPTTVVDLTEVAPRILREGAADSSPFL